MQESFDLSHRETQTSLPGPLDEVSRWQKIGTWTLPAAALSYASAFVLAVTLLYLRLAGELGSLFVMSLGWGRAVAVLSAALAWLIVFRCSRRPGLMWPRVWALILAILTSLFALLLLSFPTETWSSALEVAGFAAVLTLLPRLYKLRPDSGLVPQIAPLAFLGVLLPVLLAVGWTGRSIAASKKVRVDHAIEQVRKWTSEVRSMADRDWSGASWDDSAKAVEGLAEVRPAEQLDLSLWREATTFERDRELAAEAGKLREAAIAGLAKNRVPRVSRLNEPAAYNDGKRWVKGLLFPKASETVGRYFQEMGRIFTELDVQDSYPDSQGLADFKTGYLENKSRLTDQLSSQKEDWADHWAVFQIPALAGQSDMPLGKLLRNPSPILGKPAADLPRLLWLSYGAIHRQKPPGCRPLGPTPDLKDRNGVKMEYELYRLDCYSYSPRPKDPGADLRVEMRVVYQSIPGRDLQGSELPVEVYYLFPLPEGQKEEEFKQQVMTALSEAVRETTRMDVSPDKKTNTPATGFRVRGDGKRIVVRRPTFEDWIDGRKGLVVRAERES
jgi:hypothetical protein